MDNLIEDICDYNNILIAANRVVSNRGSSGIDRMEASQLHEWLDKNYEDLAQKLRRGKYKPNPVRRVEIPKKERGKTRKLGIPTVVDRMIQQAIVQVLTPIYEESFSENSFGFRPNRSAHDALRKVQEYANNGYIWVASIDMKKFFDKVNHSKLIQLVSGTIKDGKVVSLIHRYLMAGVMENGIRITTTKGTPQGGPLSPLLANIMLNELDKELEAREHKFVRYADDCMILKKSRRAAERVMESITRFIEKKLFLKINREKSYIAKIYKGVKYLGYGFYQKEDQIKFCIHNKTISALKDKIRQIMSRSNAWSLDYRRYRLKCLIYGWINYYKLADMSSKLYKIDSWLRRKIRCVYWKCWKKTKTKFHALIRLGVNRQKAWEWANTRKGYWRISSSYILHRALNNNILLKLGWINFTQRYKEVRCVN